MLKKSGRIGHGERGLVTPLIRAQHVVVHELVKIALRHVVGVEKVHIVFFLAPVQSPEIAGILVSARLGCAANDAEMEMERARRRHADFVPEEKVHHFVQRELFAATIALAFAGRELAPLGRHFIAALIARLQQRAVVEADAEAALARVIPPIRAAQAIVNVVKNLAVVNHRALPIEMQPPLAPLPADVLRKLIAAVEPRRALVHVGVARDERIDLQRLQVRARVREVIRNPVINEVGEVQRLVILERRAARRPSASVQVMR